ncbi:MAG TPA: acyltransferase [Capsulimonadaceae bacterium]|jgi:acetyltransferase-like isoleucine patch superfamily enzyme
MNLQSVKKLVGPAGKHAYYRLKYPAPRGLKRLGQCSFVMGPVRIEGAGQIEIGDNVSVGQYNWLNAITSYAGAAFTPKLVIGSGTYVGSFCCITCADEVTIGADCVLSEHVYISDCSHGLNPERGRIMDQPLALGGAVRIGAGSFVGYQATIMPGVSLGKHCIVGANSVVTNSFPDYSMVAGVPARLIKTWSSEAQEWVSVSA